MTLAFYLSSCTALSAGPRERCTQDWRPRPMVSAKAVRNQTVPPCVEWWDEMDNQATAPFCYCPNRLHFANARWNRCQEDFLTAAPLENWRRPPGHPRTTWMKTIQQDLKSNNLPEWSNWCASESSTLESDVYVWRYACQQWTSSISVRCKWVSKLFQYSSEFYKHWLETETWVTSAPVNTDVMGLAALEPATLLTSCDTLDAGATDLTLSGALSTVHTAPDKTHTQVTCVHIHEGYEYLLDFIYMSDRWDIPVHLRGLVEEWSITCVHGRE